MSEHTDEHHLNGHHDPTLDPSLPGPDVRDSAEGTDSHGAQGGTTETDDTTALNLLLNAIAASPEGANASATSSGDALSSLLAASEHLAGGWNAHHAAAVAHHHHHSPWDDYRHHHSPAPVSTSHKRPLSPDVASERPAKRLVESTPETPTTLTLLHPLYAQKSYGTERRLLVPPPILRVSGGALPNSVEAGLIPLGGTDGNVEVGAESRAEVTPEGTFFKGAFVAAGGGKGDKGAKEFYLNIRLFSSMAGEQPFASLRSPPISIISKPSKKTGSWAASGVGHFATGPKAPRIALFNRLASQTTSTRYLGVAGSFGLTVEADEWVPWEVIVVSGGQRQPPTASTSASPDGGAAGDGAVEEETDPPLQYNQTIQLRTEIFVTPPLIIRRVDKNILDNTAEGVVKQMHRVALERADGLFLGAGQAGEPAAVWRTAERMSGVKVGKGKGKEGEIDDAVCWTLLSTGSFSSTFHLPPSYLNPASPNPLSITPLPRLTTQPYYRPLTHSLDLTVSSLFRPPSPFAQEQLALYLGPLGPLSTRVTHRSLPPGDAGLLLRLQPAAPEDADEHVGEERMSACSVQLPGAEEIAGAGGEADEGLRIAFGRSDGVRWEANYGIRVIRQEDGGWAVAVVS